MTKTKSHSTPAVKKTAKKADPFAALKSSIMMVSIAGTMAGWLVLLNQEKQPAPVSTAIISTAVTQPDERAVTPTLIADINQLRQVNTVASVEAIRVVARTRSSR